MRALIALLIWLAAPALATQDAWPALFDVEGVAQDDVLNIRSGPGAARGIVGQLAPDAQGIEVVRPNDLMTWGLVNTGEATGWVSLTYLRRRAGQWQGAFPRLAACFGTEPFWSITIDGDAVQMSTPLTQDAGQVVTRAASSARRDRHGLRLVFDGADGQGGVQLDGIISWRSCSDGMSDREYGLAFDALHGADVLSGCCTLSR